MVNWVSKYINKIAVLNVFILLYLLENPVRTILYRVRAFLVKYSLNYNIDMQLEEKAFLAFNSNVLLLEEYKA